jgi:hypothetical protein
MSLLGDLFGTGKQTTTTAATPQVPADVEAARKDLLARAQAFAAEPFPLYNQPQTAGFTPDQLAGFGTARNLAAESGALAALTPDLVEEGVSASRGLATTLPETDIAAYMSPYTEAVLDPAIRDIEERAARSRLALGQQSARTGSFGGSRQAIAEGELERGTQRNIAEQSALQRQQAYNQALQQFRLDQQRIPELYSGAIGQVGAGLNQVAGRFGTEVNPLLQIGGAQQALDQRNLDVLRRSFEEERDYPLKGIDVLRGSLGLSSQNLGIGNTEQRSQPGANPLSTIIGGAAQIPGLVSNVKTGIDFLRGLS